MEHPELGGTRTGSCAGPLGLPEPRTTVGRAERQVCLYLEAEPRARATRLPDSPSLLLLRAHGLVLMGLSPPRRDTRRIEAGCALATSSYLKCTCKDPISTRSYWGAGLEHVSGTELHPQQGP